MRIGVPAEIRPGETRVAATPETVGKLVQKGRHTCIVQSNAGTAASIPDTSFQAAGAAIVPHAADVFSQSDVILKVRAPEPSELALVRRGSILIGLLNPHDEAAIEKLAETGVTAFALEAVPRITRAQTMDVLSSQANVAGYKAVLIAANEYRRFMPLLMTAAGTVKAARVLVLGAGVAGLQAIATARRLGAVVEAFDVRPAVKEQVESLGARFIEVPVSDAERGQAETAGGYAREMSAEYRERQAALIAERAGGADIVVTTALVPGRPAPRLLSEDTVKAMKPGSVIVDLAVEQGGNCALVERDRIVVAHGVRIVGYSNLPALLAADASALYARNVLNFLQLLVNPATGALEIDRNDEIIAATLVCADGAPARKRETSLA
jgi:NAD(P) transhydrogenase subunit alpha